MAKKGDKDIYIYWGDHGNTLYMHSDGTHTHSYMQCSMVFLVAAVYMLYSMTLCVHSLSRDGTSILHKSTSTPQTMQVHVQSCICTCIIHDCVHVNLMATGQVVCIPH